MTKFIVLTQGPISLVDDADCEHFSQWKWQHHNWGYAYRNTRIKGKSYKLFLHREILNAPPDSIVDHINGDPLDNRRANLRLATPSQSTANSQKRKNTKTSKYKGVSFRRNRPNQPWQATIGWKHKWFYLGTFPSEEEAARAYDAKARELHGEFARTNF